MTSTFSLCNECFQQIPAVADPFKDDTTPMLYKICPEHGMQRGQLESDREFYARFHTYERMDKYPVGIINITDRCNTKCKYCYHPCGESTEITIDEIRTILHGNNYMKGYVLSGGEPTCHSDFFEITRLLNKANIPFSLLTNGILLDDDVFLAEGEKNGLVEGGVVKAQVSMHGESQNPHAHKHHLSFLAKLRQRGQKIHQAMINIEDPSISCFSIHDEVDRVVKFMDEWRDVVPVFRVRAVCNVWAETKIVNHIYTSELFRAFQLRAMNHGKSFEANNLHDVNNIYNVGATYDGMNMSLISAPRLESIDIGYLNRGPYMLAHDKMWYSVPHALMINEGIEKGFYQGRRLNG